MKGVHGDDEKPQGDLHPTLGTDTQQGERKGGLAHGTRHDDEGLRDLPEERDGDGILRDLEQDPFEMATEASRYTGFDDSAVRQ